MKSKFIYSLIVLTSVSLLSSNCFHNDDDSNDDDGGQSGFNNVIIQDIQNTDESGAWRITSFIDSGQDETNHFTGFSFQFLADGTLIATRDNSTLSGTWSVTDSNSNDDSSDDIDFNMFFNVSNSNDFEDLNDDWHIVSHSDNRISLIDISGGNGGTDTIIFERN